MTYNSIYWIIIALRFTDTIQIYSNTNFFFLTPLSVQFLVNNSPNTLSTIPFLGFYPSALHKYTALCRSVFILPTVQCRTKECSNTNNEYGFTRWIMCIYNNSIEPTRPRKHPCSDLILDTGCNESTVHLPQLPSLVQRHCIRMKDIYYGPTFRRYGRVVRLIRNQSWKSNCSFTNRLRHPKFRVKFCIGGWSRR